MGSGIRQPFHWEAPLDSTPTPQLPHPVVVPGDRWRDRRQRNTETPNARNAIDRMAQRYVDHTRDDDRPMTHVEGQREATGCAHRHDFRTR